MTNSVTFSAPNFSTSFAPTSSWIPFDAASRASFFRGQQSGHEAVAGEGFGFMKISSGTMLSVISRFFLPPRAASSFCASDERLAAFLAEFQRGDEISFGDFLGRAFIHDDVGFVADVNQIEIAVGAFPREWDWR
jgi:hypothetical protein